MRGVGVGWLRNRERHKEALRTEIPEVVPGHTAG